MRTAALAVLGVLVLALAQVPGPPRQARGDGLPFRATIPLVSAERKEHPVEVALREAEARWAEAGITHYTITVAIYRFGPHERHTIVVEEGEPVSIESSCTLGDQPYPCDDVDPERYTVEGLFGFVRETLAAIGPPPPVPPGSPGVVVPGRRYVDAVFSEPYGVPSLIETGLSVVPDSGVTLVLEEFGPLD